MEASGVLHDAPGEGDGRGKEERVEARDVEALAEERRGGEEDEAAAGVGAGGEVGEGGGASAATDGAVEAVQSRRWWRRGGVGRFGEETGGVGLEVGEVFAVVAEDGEGAAFAEAGGDVGGDLFVADAGGDEGGPELVDGCVGWRQIGRAGPHDEATPVGGGIGCGDEAVANGAALQVKEFLKSVLATRRGGEAENEAGGAGLHDGLEASGGDVAAPVDDDVRIGREEGRGVR